MAVYLVKGFDHWRSSEGLTDESLLQAVEEIENGLIDATLGAGLIKKRVAAPGRGKSGAFRTIIAFRKGANSFFIVGFSKNEKDNTSKRELKALKALSKIYLGLGTAQLDQAIAAKELIRLR